MNMAIADNLRTQVDISDPAMKEILAKTALCCLVVLQNQGYDPNYKIGQI
jgi:hypothetical protein